MVYKVLSYKFHIQYFYWFKKNFFFFYKLSWQSNDEEIIHTISVLWIYNLKLSEKLLDP